MTTFFESQFDMVVYIIMTTYKTVLSQGDEKKYVTIST